MPCWSLSISGAPSPSSFGRIDAVARATRAFTILCTRSTGSIYISRVREAFEKPAAKLLDELPELEISKSSMEKASRPDTAASMLCWSWPTPLSAFGDPPVRHEDLYWAARCESSTTASPPAV